MAETSNNQIAVKQNSEWAIERLAAGSQFYAQAKKLSGLQAILTVPVPIFLSILAVFFPEQKVWAAFYGVTISLIDSALFDRMQQNLKKTGAKIQELFDCELLGTRWNEFKAGDKLAPEKIHGAAQKYKAKSRNISKLHDWYSPSVAQLPLCLARTVCQRTNIYWDSELRQRYIAVLWGIIIILIIVAVATALILKMNMESFLLSILTPILPTIQWLVREIKRQRDSVATLDRLAKYVNTLWNDTLDSKLALEQIENKNRALQDEIFSHRQSNQLIFNWIFKLLRRQQEEQMNVGASELVKEAIHRRPDLNT